MGFRAGRGCGDTLVHQLDHIWLLVYGTGLSCGAGSSVFTCWLVENQSLSAPENEGKIVFTFDNIMRLHDVTYAQGWCTSGTW